MRQLTFPIEISPEAAAVNKIKSYLGTLDMYRRTSQQAHGRLIQSVFDLAVELEDKVNTLQLDLPHSAEVARWYNKFEEYLIQYKLI